MDERCGYDAAVGSRLYFAHWDPFDSILCILDPRTIPLGQKHPHKMKILTADHVLPIASEPLSSGAVAIDGDSIVMVGDITDIRSKFPEAEVQDFGAAAMLPGFVNCHSHLEITSMRG